MSSQDAGRTIRSLPSPIAIPMRHYLDETAHPVVRLWGLCDAIEMILRLLSAVALGQRDADGKPLPLELSEELKRGIRRPTMAVWSALTQTLWLQIAKSPETPCSELVGLVNKVLVPLIHGARTANESSSVVRLRNRLAHGAGMTARSAEKLLRHWQQQVAVDDPLWASIGKCRLFVMRADGKLGELRGPIRTPRVTRIKSSEQLDGIGQNFINGNEVVCEFDGSLFVLWPLVICGHPLPRDRTEHLKHEYLGQIYQRTETKAEFTPIGSELICQSVGDAEVKAWLERYLFPAPQRTSLTYRGWDKEALADAEECVGRRAEATTLLQAMEVGWDQVLWVAGVAGVGKSFLMAKVFQALSDPCREEHAVRLPKDLLSGKSVILPIIWRFKQGDRCSSRDFFDAILERLQHFFADAGAKPLKPQHIAADPNGALAQLLVNASADYRVILLLDGMDEIEAVEPGFISKTILPNRRAHVMWVCAGRPEAGMAPLFEKDGCVTVFPEGAPGMSEPDIREMFLARLSGRSRRRFLEAHRDSGDRVISDFIDEVARRADGLPLYVRYVINDALAARVRHFELGDALNLPASLDAYFEELLSRLRISDQHAILTPLACLLAVSRDALSQGALEAMLQVRSLLPVDRPNHGLLEAALDALRSITKCVHGNDGELAYTPYHTALRQHILSSDAVRHAVANAAADIIAACGRWKEDPRIHDYAIECYASHLLDGLAESSDEESRLKPAYSVSPAEAENSLKAARQQIQKLIDVASAWGLVGCAAGSEAEDLRTCIEVLKETIQEGCTDLAERLSQLLTDEVYCREKATWRRIEALAAESEHTYRYLRSIGREASAESVVKAFAEAALRACSNISSEDSELVVDAEIIHSILVYRPSPGFYKAFLDYATERESMETLGIEAPTAALMATEFLARRGNFHRRTGPDSFELASEALEAAATSFRGLLNGATSNALQKRIWRELSRVEYDLGYVAFLQGAGETAEQHFESSESFAIKAGGVLGAAITRCVRMRAGFELGTMSPTAFRATCEEERDLFLREFEESRDPTAERWIMNTRYHLFESFFALGDSAGAQQAARALRADEWKSRYHPEYWGCMCNLIEARLAMLEQNWEVAVSFFQSALMADGEFSEQLLVLEGAARNLLDYGRALVSAGRREEAQTVWEKALTNCPDKFGNIPWKKRIRQEIC